MQSASRILFMMTLFVYENYQSLREMMEDVHFYFTYSYIGLMALEFLVGIFDMIIELKDFIK